MTEIKSDKKAESILALKNANKHLSELFTEMNKKDEVLRSQADQIAQVAKQCGDLCVEVWVGGKFEKVSLRTYLNAAVTALNGARS